MGEEKVKGFILVLCDQIAKAEAILKLSKLGSQAADEKGLGLQLRVLTDDKPLMWKAAGRTVYDGQQIIMEMKNNSFDNLDLTVLYVDSQYGVTCLYPRVGENNRLGVGDTDQIELTVHASTTGIENLLVIAATTRSNTYLAVDN